MATVSLVKKSSSNSVVARAKVMRVTLVIWGWGFSFYVPQMVFALLCVAGLGLYYVYNESWTQFVFNLVVENFFGFTTDASIIFIFCWFLVLAIGWGTVAAAAIVYKVSFFSPFFGEKGASVKICAFLLALLGYAIPLANIFPWFVLYTLAVTRYPK